MITNERIWITGASTGMGFELTRLLLQQGNQVIASARNCHPLEALREQYPQLSILPMDLNRRDQFGRLYEQLSALCDGVLDRVILNAGDCQYLDSDRVLSDPLAEADNHILPDIQTNASATHSMMETNFWGQLFCIDLSKTLLSRAPKPHLIWVSSQVIYAPFPRAQAYGASKAAMQYFFDALRIDLMPSGFDLTAIQPGFVDTPLTRKNTFDMPFLMPADKAAEVMAAGIASRKTTLIFPRRLWLVLKLATWFPKAWARRLSRQQSTRKGEVSS